MVAAAALLVDYVLTVSVRSPPGWPLSRRRCRTGEHKSPSASLRGRHPRWHIRAVRESGRIFAVRPTLSS